MIGAGVVGLCSAYYLARDGHEVVVYERDGPERQTTSFGNAGMIVPSHFVPLAAPGVIAQALRWLGDPTSPFYLKPRPSPELLAWGYRFWRASTPAKAERAAPLLLSLNLASRAAYHELATELGDDFGLADRGLLIICRSEEGFAEERRVATAAQDLGLQVQTLGATEARALEPAIDAGVAGALHYRNDSHLDPGRFMAVMQAQLERLGVEFRWGAKVTGLRRERGRVSGVSGSTTTTVGTPRALTGHEAAGREDGHAAVAFAERHDAVVLAGGSWSAALARDVGLRLLLQPGKGYSMTVDGPGSDLRTPAILSEARVAVTPLGSRLRLGGTMEISGFDDSKGERRVRAILDAAGGYLSGLDLSSFDPAASWHGFRPCSPDGLPYLGSVPGSPGLTVATGHAMMGVSLGPVSGRLVADLVAAREPNIDIAALAPTRHSWMVRA